jgi:hypothetical protein
LEPLEVDQVDRFILDVSAENVEIVAVVEQIVRDASGLDRRRRQGFLPRLQIFGVSLGAAIPFFAMR